MGGERFGDRLLRSNYPADVVVGVYRANPAESDAVWIDERLFGRLILLGRAYEMHTLPLLGGSDPVQLERPQIQSLVDELEFVEARVNDPLMTQTVQVLVDYLATQLRATATDVVVTVEAD